jgi:SanA protein
MLFSRWSLYLMGMAFVLFTGLGLFLPRWLLQQFYADRIYTPDDVPVQQTALVLGAGLRRDGGPTTVLADRVQTAAMLYSQDKVTQIIMSGSVRAGHNEPAAMRAYAIELGVPAEAILLDTGGTRTYETCQRARQLFDVEQAAIVSQRFHLPRALALCEAIGIRATGVSADLSSYRAHFVWELREIPATIRAFWDVHRYGNALQFMSLHHHTADEV